MSSASPPPADAPASAPRVSVVMAVYQGEAFLKESLDSILGQTFEDFEFVVIDDASTDGTADLLAACDDRRLRVLRNERNEGLTRSLNRGIRAARGELVARQDADDVSLSGRLAAQVAYLDQHPGCAVVGSGVEAIDDRGQRLYEIERPLSPDDVAAFLERDCAIQHGSALMRRACLYEVGLYDESIEYAQDYDLFLRLSRCYTLANLPECLYRWRDHGGSISRSLTAAQAYYADVVRRRGRAKRMRRLEPPAPSISVLMANHDNAAWVGEAIESVLAQTERDWELVVIDDASSDASLRVIEPYLKDPRIRLLNNERNEGYIETSRRLVAAARSEIVAILDSDDALAPRALEAVLDVYRRDRRCAFVYTDMVYCDEQMQPIGGGWGEAIPEGESNLHRDVIIHMRSFRKWAYAATTGFDSDMLHAEDKDLLFKLEEVARPIFVDEPLYRYRRVPGSATQDPAKKRRGLVSFALARAAAHVRRRGTDVPNIGRMSALGGLFVALGRSVAGGDARAAARVLRAGGRVLWPR